MEPGNRFCFGFNEISSPELVNRGAYKLSGARELSKNNNVSIGTDLTTGNT